MNNSQPTPPSTPQPPYQPGDVVNGWQLSAGGEWKPVPGAERGAPAWKPEPPKKSHTTRNVFLVIGVVIFVLFAGCTALVAVIGGSVDDVGTSDPGSVSQGLGANDATADVVLGAAEAPDAIGITYLPVVVTNSSGKRSDYYVEVEATAPDGSRVELSNVLVLSLDPGQAATEQAMFADELPAGIVFKVIQVQRTASL